MSCAFLLALIFSVSLFNNALDERPMGDTAPTGLI